MIEFVLGQFTFKAGISPTTPTSQLTINDVQRYTQGFGNVHYTVGETIWRRLPGRTSPRR